MKIGYHAVYDKNMEEAITFAGRNEIDFVQFDLGVPRFFLDDLSDKRLYRLQSLAKDANVELTLHGPCDNVSLFCDYPFIRKGILRQYESILYKANLLNARHITIHTGDHPHFKTVNSLTDEFSRQYRDYYAAVLQENLSALIRMSGNVLICVENDGFHSLVMDTVGKMLGKEEALFLTCDIPKLYSKDLILNKETAAFYQTYKNEIRELHIHDYGKVFGRHQSIGEGEIDFSLYTDFYRLENVYGNFEVRPKEAALFSIEKFKSLYA